MRLILATALALVSSAALSREVVKQVTAPIPEILPYPREPCLNIAVKHRSGKGALLLKEATVVSRDAARWTVSCRFEQID